MTIGDRVRELRRRKALTQGQLAEAVGRDRSTISLIESNHNFPQPGTIQRIADALDVPPEALTDPFWKPPVPKNPTPEPPSPEWALEAPDGEFDNWIETVGGMTLHKFFTEASRHSRDLKDTERRAHLLWRAQLGINEFFRRYPVEKIVDKRPRAAGEPGEKKSKGA